MNIWKKAAGYPKLGLVILAYVAFIALGMPDGLLGIAWPSIRGDFSLPLDSLGMLLAASVSGYTLSSFSSGKLIAHLGVGKMLAISCALTGAALLGYTLSPVWELMVMLGVAAGLGAGAIDAGLNTYVAAHFGEGLMQWLHASYGIGVTSGPVVMTFALATMNSWRAGYRAVSGFQFALAVCFVFTLAMWDRQDDANQAGEPQRLTDYKTPMRSTLRRPQAWLSALLFFLYVGGEVSFGAWTYSLLTEARAIEPAAAGLAAGSYWASFTVGRMIAGLYAKRVGVDMLVQGSLVIALLGVAVLIWNPADVANLLAAVMIGFAIAPIFPALMSGVSRRVGIHHAANTIGLQMAASGLGTAVVPAALGVLARRFSLEIIPLCLAGLFLCFLVCYRLSLAK